MEFFSLFMVVEKDTASCYMKKTNRAMTKVSQNLSAALPIWNNIL